MIITFLGHSSIPSSKELSMRVKETIEKNIMPNESVSFYCGGYGDFDNLCAGICRAIKKNNENCKLIFITPYMTKSQQKKMKYLLDSKLYDEIAYPPLENIPPRLAIIKRNEWMIDKADIIIAYVEYSYGGAYKAFEYAGKKQKRIFNLAE